VSAPWVDTPRVPMPTDAKTAWPPKAWAPVLADISEAAAWYSGDTSALAGLYGKQDSSTSRRRFWSTPNRDRQGQRVRQKLHVPAAADVATASADLLFGEAPKLTIPEAHEESSDTEAKDTQDRLDQLAGQTGLTNTLLEAAEICSGLGGVYLRPWWNPEIMPMPLLSTVHADHAVPRFVAGVLVEVTFWRTLHVDAGSSVWRHLEHHQHGRIEHALFVGGKDALGIRRPLADHPDTADLAVDDDGLVDLPESIDGLLVRYVPNMLPNRRRRGTVVGRSDTAGAEDLMDALDETWTSWLRDIRIGQARIIVANEMLSRAGRGSGASFDLDQEVFSPLEFDPTADGAKSITPVEFKIRTEEHAATAMQLWQQIVSTGGYSQQTFGMQGDGANQTATEVRAREGRTLRTTKKKQRYWAPQVEDVAEIMLIIDREVFGSKVTPMRPRLDFEDGLVDDPRTTAETIELLNRAQAISIETRVRMAQPQLEGDELKAEVERIRAEQGLAVDDPTGGLP